MNDDNRTVRPIDLNLTETEATTLTDTRQHVAQVGTIELREERLFVNKQREVAGSLNLSREVRRETVQVPVELVTEVLVIEHQSGDHAVMLDGELIQPGQKREIVVYREDAIVDKRVVVSEIVNIGKRVVTETRTFDATLAREELVVNEEGELRRVGEVNPTERR